MFAVNSERFLFNQCFTPSERIIMNNNNKIIKWHTVLLSHLPPQPRPRWWSDTLQPLRPSWEIKNCLPSCMTAANIFFLPFFFSLPLPSPFHLKRKNTVQLQFLPYDQIYDPQGRVRLACIICLSLIHIAVSLPVSFCSLLCLLYSAIFSPPANENPACWMKMSRIWWQKLWFFFPLFQQQAQDIFSLNVRHITLALCYRKPRVLIKSGGFFVS